MYVFRQFCNGSRYCMDTIRREGDKLIVSRYEAKKYQRHLLGREETKAWKDREATAEDVQDTILDLIGTYFTADLVTIDEMFWSKDQVTIDGITAVKEVTPAPFNQPFWSRTRKFTNANGTRATDEQLRRLLLNHIDRVNAAVT